MNISKNTEKKLPKIKGNPLKNLPPIDSMDTWGSPVPDFVEKRTWKLKGILSICFVLGIALYSLKGKCSSSLKSQEVTQEYLQQRTENEIVQLDLDADSLTSKVANYDTEHQQAFLKIASEAVPVLTDEEDSDEEEPKETSATIAQQIRTWLHQQHIQGVAYKDFESCIVVNGKIFHLNEVVAPELNLVWSDIDPVAKKLFFYDANGVLYFINY